MREQNWIRRCARVALVLVLCGALSAPGQLAYAGGPLYVGSPTMGTDGAFLIWNPATMPVHYRVDGGSLARRPNGTDVYTAAQSVTRVNNMFKVWQDVPTSAISYANDGGILSAGSFTGGDVNTVNELADVFDSCEAGTQSPVVFDADGSMTIALFGDPFVIGFAGVCKIDPATGFFRSGLAVMNGIWQNQTTDPSRNDYELTASEFDEAIIHELGHFSGLDHSQINVEVLNGTPGSCSTNNLAGLPLMFPFAFCQARSTAGLPTLAPDDIAWISRLYPTASFNSSYGTISGHVFFSDGVTPVQGVNVIARAVDNPSTAGVDESRRMAVSVVSGYLFTGQLGQSVTTNSPPSDFGSRNSQLLGSFAIPVPPGTYRVQVESVYPGFVAGSSVGPLSPPIPSPGPNEFWNSGESATDDPTTATDITVTAGGTVSNIDIILNGTPPRFDSFESPAAQLNPPAAPAWLRRDQLLPQEVPA